MFLFKSHPSLFINHVCVYVHKHTYTHMAVCLDKVSTCDSGLGLCFWEEACWDQSACAFNLVWSAVFGQLVLLLMFVDFVL